MHLYEIMMLVGSFAPLLCIYLKCLSFAISGHVKITDAALFLPWILIFIFAPHYVLVILYIAFEPRVGSAFASD